MTAHVWARDVTAVARVVLALRFDVVDKIESSVEWLEKFAVATKMCEGSNSNMLDTIRAVAAMGLADLDRKKNGTLFKKFRERFLCAPLVVTAVACRVADVTQIGFDRITGLVATVLSSNVVTNMAKYAGIDAKVAQTEFDSMLTDDSGARDMTRYSKQRFYVEMHDLQQKQGKTNIAKIFIAIAGCISGEGSAERGFSATKRTARQDRKGLVATSVEAAVKIRYQSEFFLRRDEPVAAEQVVDVDAAAAAAAAIEVEFVKAVRLIIEQAIVHLAALEKKAERGEKGMLAPPSSRTKCAKCGAIKWPRNGNASNVPKYIQCVCCFKYWDLPCLNIVEPSAGARQTWRCAECKNVGVQPPIW